MRKIEARVLYDVIKAEGSGLYVWCTPDELSVLKISRLLKHAPFKTTNSTDWYTTILHCRSDLPDIEVEVPDFKYSGVVQAIDHWVDHKQRNIFVLRVECPGLTDLNARLQKVGLSHSHEEYNPHITICKDAVLDAADRMWLTATNTYLQANPLTIEFNDKLMASTVD